MENTKKNTIVVNPVTRIEGHGKITVDLTDDGAVDRARFHVTQYRGFEIFSKGRDFREMPVITPRICGICPVSHHLASAKACDAILGVTITPTAAKLREVMHMGQFIQSHALSFFHLSSPDLLFGFDADPAIRNVAGLAQEYPDLAMAGIGMRKYGQEIIKTLGGKKIHPWHSIPGGVNRSLRPEERDGMLAALPKLKEDLRKALDLVKNYLAENAELAARFATIETSYLGLVKDGNLELYDGRIRLKSPRGRITDEFDDSEYCTHIGEHVEEWSYLKFPFYRPLGFPQGSYRVGPLGRINACDDISTPEASAELAAFRKSTDDGMVHYTLYYHYARLIEILYSMERLEELLNDPDVLGSDLRITGNVTNREGIGVVEAPRGTLIHHYMVDDKGAIERVNLIVATGHNNYAMNRGVEQVARDYITGPDVKEGALNRMEHVIRCYDPCLSCSTHAVGKMPLKLEVRNSRGDVVRTVIKE
ncbi:Ni/Fe hydrogenase subunit alpha [Aminivibrio sp.]|jgi:NAD-reducing hydrogenase large subunit|uniref:Ni/Fe hydrogenase subunit alpha n=1 Tax=Aminivibrio sp. TaxID=1872489 RepID=UPI001A3C619B|nr:Ni/Fe hydrogenase subunit alpha [Aminivibrio sp.]MBL3540214.1 Ni/Fe hydrogenase subunit alpha [Aminivibrio sp.]MDK2959423.1 NAD-reducing hydrogenase large subunit [Synergistaceae bacterium]